MISGSFFAPDVLCYFLFFLVLKVFVDISFNSYSHCFTTHKGICSRHTINMSFGKRENNVTCDFPYIFLSSNDIYYGRVNEIINKYLKHHIMNKRSIKVNFIKQITRIDRRNRYMYIFTQGIITSGKICKLLQNTQASLNYNGAYREDYRKTVYSRRTFCNLRSRLDAESAKYLSRNDRVNLRVLPRTLRDDTGCPLA